MKNGRFQVGIIGCGGIAGAHAHNYKLMNDVDIVALADIVPGKAEAFKEKYGFDNAHVYKSHTELLENEHNLDAVSICTYNRAHAIPTIDALNCGINVLLEKPMCVTLEEGLEMMKAEKKSGKILSVGFQPRYDYNMQFMKNIIRQGEIGKVYYIQTGGGRRRGIPGSSFIEDSTGGIGALGDIGCYSLDMVLDAIGYPKPLTVTAYTSNFIGTNPLQYKEAHRFEVDDFAAAFIRLEGDIVIDFRIAWAMNVDTPGDTIFLGTEGGLRIPSTNCWNGDFDGMTLYKTIDGQDTQTDFPKIPHNGLDPTGCFYFKLRSFLDAIKNGGSAPVSTKQIIINQAILDAIVRSSKLGREVEVNIPEI